MFYAFLDYLVRHHWVISRALFILQNDQRYYVVIQNWNLNICGVMPSSSHCRLHDNMKHLEKPTINLTFFWWKYTNLFNQNHILLYFFIFYVNAKIKDAFCKHKHSSACRIVYLPCVDRGKIIAALIAFICLITKS